MEYTPYLSIDIETTSLDPSHGVILEIGAVFDDFITPIEKLKTISLLIKNNEPIRGDHYALQMNQKIIQEIITLDSHDIIVARSLWSTFLWSIKNENGLNSITPAGKNAAGFDIPWLKYHGFLTSEFHYRVLDPGSMYFEDFGKIPGLEKINNVVNCKNKIVTHRALDDAFDVVRAIRFKLGIKF